MRLLITVALAALALLAGSAAFSAAFAKAAPAAAAEQPIGGGNAMARTALALLAASFDPQTPQRAAVFPEEVPDAAVAMARGAFEREPLSSDAVLVMALEANAEADRSRARALFGSLNRLTRRNELANLWLAQDALQRNEEVHKALHLFDVVLRTTKVGRADILRQFVAATSNRDLRNGLAEMLQSNPPWAKEFWSLASEQSATAREIGELRLKTATSGYEFDLEHDRALALQLLNTGNFDTAAALYRQLADGARQPPNERVRNWQFDRRSRFPLVDWETYSSGDFGSEIQPQPGVLLFSAVTSMGGEVARAWVRLPPGRYRLSAKLSVTTGGGENAKVFARLTCLKGERWRQFELANGRTSAEFVVPAGLCRDLWLDVVATPGDGSLGVDGQLDYLSIRPALTDDDGP